MFNGMSVLDLFLNDPDITRKCIEDTKAVN